MFYLIGTSRFKAWTCETRSFPWSMTWVAPTRLQESIVSLREAVAMTAGRLSTLRDSWIAALPTPPPPLICLARTCVSYCTLYDDTD
jgi:hypothetical protein